MVHSKATVLSPRKFLEHYRLKNLCCRPNWIEFNENIVFLGKKAKMRGLARGKIWCQASVSIDRECNIQAASELSDHELVFQIFYYMWCLNSLQFLKFSWKSTHFHNNNHFDREALQQISEYKSFSVKNI